MEEHLNPELRGKYRIKNTHLPLVLQSPIGDIDFRTLTEDQASKLVAVDFYYLEKVEDAPKAKKFTPAVAPVLPEQLEQAAEAENPESE